MMRSDTSKQMVTPPNKIKRDKPTGNAPKKGVMGSGKMSGMGGAKGAMAHTEGCCAKGKGHMGCK